MAMIESDRIPNMPDLEKLMKEAVTKKKAHQYIYQMLLEAK